MDEGKARETGISCGFHGVHGCAKASTQFWSVLEDILPSFFVLLVCFYRNMEGKEVNSSFVVPRTLWDFEYIFQELATKIY